MKRLSLIFCFCMGLSLFLSAENNDDITIKRERVFTGTGLYGFMNGGADLFLEYGVKKLTTRDLVYLNEEYTLEIYEMPTPEDAYGIYSVHTFRCTQADVNDGINCHSAYQLQTVASNFYISLVFPSGSEKAKANAKDVLQRYIADIEGENVFFPEQIQTSVPMPYSGTLKFLRGPISISGAQQSLAVLLKEIKCGGVWFAAGEEEGENRALILFDDIESATPNIELLKKAIEADDILASGETWLFIRSRDAKKSPIGNNS